jgi:pimeloyl-ACP methyl ester carboxylesterase
VLVHPLGLDRMLWRDVVRALSPRRTVVVPDLRGHGDASGAAAPDPEAIVTDLVALVERLDLHEVVLAGAGSGAWLAAMAGARLEDRVERVVLVGPSDAPTPADPADALLAWATPRTIARDPWVVRHVRDRLARPPAAAVPLLERRLLESAPRGPAGRTEIVLGAEDPGAAAGPGPRIVAGAAGLVALDAPEGVAEVLAGT